MISQRRQIKCVEYGEWISKKDIESKSNRNEDINFWAFKVAKANQDLKQNLGLRNDPIKLKSHSLNDFSIRFEAISGSLIISNIEFLISPKYLGNIDDNIWIATLYQMIEYSSSDKFSITDTSHFSKTSYNSFLDILALSLCQHLTRALPNGLITTYVTNTYYSSFAKGKIKVDRNIMKTLTSPHKLLVETDQLSIHNPFNELIKWVMVKMSGEVSNQNIKNKLSYFLDYFSEIDLKDPNYNIRNLNYTNLPPQFKSYKKVIDICNWYVNNSIGTSGGNGDTSKGVVINTETVFENFLEYCLKVISLRNNFIILSQKKLPFANEIMGYRKNKVIQPDNVLMKDDVVKLVIDAKYKGTFRDQDKEILNLKEADLYQMVSYSIGLNCNYSLIIMPFSTEKYFSIREWEVKVNEDRTIKIYTSGLNLMELVTPQGIKKLIDQLETMVLRLI